METARRKETWKKFVEGILTKRELVKRLNSIGAHYTDDSEEYGYPNIHIRVTGGEIVRIYRGPKMKDFQVQVWKPVIFRHSGIPTFEPSGRRSL